MRKKQTGFLIAMLCMASAVFALATTVTSSVSGYQRVEKPAGKLNLVGNGFGGEASTLNEIVSVDEFNGDVLYKDADRVIVWIPGNPGGYKTYALYDDGSTIAWRDGDAFYGSDANPVIPAGSAFWVQSLGSTIDTNLVLFGDVVSDQSVTNQIMTGLQMLAYPFSTSVDLNETLLAGGATGALLYKDADHVITWDASTNQNFTTYALYDDGNTREWRDSDYFYSAAGSINVDLGAGFWYEAKSGFSWVETNKYYNSL